MLFRSTLAKDYPGQVQCIFLRNTSATDKEDLFPYDTGYFKDLPQKSYMFFKAPNDLTNLDIAGGNCYNASIPQNVTFGMQAELLGIHGAAGRAAASWMTAVLAAALATFFVSL